MNAFHGPAPKARTPEEMMELVLLLPHSQVEALEREALRRGLNAGQLLRQVIHEYLNRAE